MNWYKEAACVFWRSADYGKDYWGVETDQEMNDDWRTWCAGSEL